MSKVRKLLETIEEISREQAAGNLQLIYKLKVDLSKDIDHHKYAQDNDMADVVMDDTISNFKKMLDRDLWDKVRVMPSVNAGASINTQVDYVGHPTSAEVKDMEMVYKALAAAEFQLTIDVKYQLPSNDEVTIKNAIAGYLDKIQVK